MPIAGVPIAGVPAAYMSIAICPSRVQMVVIAVFRVLVTGSVDSLLAIETHFAGFWIMQRRFSCMILPFAGVQSREFFSSRSCSESELGSRTFSSSISFIICMNVSAFESGRGGLVFTNAARSWTSSPHNTASIFRSLFLLSPHPAHISRRLFSLFSSFPFNARQASSRGVASARHSFSLFVHPPHQPAHAFCHKIHPSIHPSSKPSRPG